MSALISFAGAFALAARLLKVRIRLKTRRLRRARRSVWRARLAADLVLAMRSKNCGWERHGCAPICQPRVRDQARPFRNHAVASDFFAGATDVFGASGVTLAFSAPGFDESTVKTACVGAGAEAGAETSVPLAARLTFGKWSGVICTIAPMGNC